MAQIPVKFAKIAAGAWWYPNRVSPKQEWLTDGEDPIARQLLCQGFAIASHQLQQDDD